MDTQGEWVSLSLASQEQGVSIQTLRRKIKRQEIEARQVTTSHGLAWQVKLLRPDNEQGRVESLGSQEPIQAQQDELTLEMVHWLKNLQVENRNLAGQVGFLQSKLQTTQGQLEQAQEIIRALEAPKGPEIAIEEPETAENREVVAEASPEHQQPWWRRFWQLVSV